MDEKGINFKGTSNVGLATMKSNVDAGMWRVVSELILKVSIIDFVFVES